jgi:hypothetical protein
MQRKSKGKAQVRKVETRGNQNHFSHTQTNQEYWTEPIAATDS